MYVYFGLGRLSGNGLVNLHELLLTYKLGIRYAAGLPANLQHRYSSLVNLHHKTLLLCWLFC